MIFDCHIVISWMLALSSYHFFGWSTLMGFEVATFHSGSASQATPYWLSAANLYTRTAQEMHAKMENMRTLSPNQLCELLSQSSTLHMSVQGWEVANFCTCGFMCRHTTLHTEATLPWLLLLKGLFVHSPGYKNYLPVWFIDQFNSQLHSIAILSIFFPIMRLKLEAAEVCHVCKTFFHSWDGY